MRFTCQICRVEVDSTYEEDRGEYFYVICPRGHEQFVKKARHR
ncbi:MAG: hypothetical protein NZ957_04770 [Thaumarchaeota archaeon]|nr:hypothetical protein [Candidatus Calditenuaceae archaeon]MDW8041663.1 hypothetical protein [Nitrososphaerota archaeon]